MSLTPLQRATLPEGARPWGDFTLWLLPPEDLMALPDGTLLVDIFGQVVAKSADMDTDTRCGCTAYGHPDAQGGVS